MDHKAPDAFRTISEVADELDLPQHVLRFWETRFRDIKPMKRGGGRRYYRPDDVDLLRGIRHLLYGEGYTIRGVQRILREQGAKFVQAVWQEGAPQPPHGATEEEAADDEAGVTETGEAFAEGHGLGGRLGALIGRDLGEGDGEERQEPPLKSAPVPRIDQADRSIHTAAPPAVPPAPQPQRIPQAASAPPPPPAAPASAGGAGLSRDDFRRLHAALHELGECRKLIDGAATRGN